MPDVATDHRAMLDQALQAMDERTYWSAFPEHPKAYGEDAPERGQSEFEALLGSPFTTDQHHDGYVETAETSPYGIELGITYPATTSTPRSKLRSTPWRRGAVPPRMNEPWCVSNSSTDWRRPRSPWPMP